MAVLDLSLLTFFTPVIGFLLVFLMLYAAFTSFKLFGENKVLHAGIAFFISLLVLIYQPIGMVIITMAPWFTFLFIFFILIIIVFRIFGVPEESISGALRNVSGLRNLIIFICILIAFGALANVFGQGQLDVRAGQLQESVTDVDSTQTVDFKTNLFNTLYHPKVLGLMFFLVVASVTVYLMSSRMRADWPPHE